MFTRYHNTIARLLAEQQHETPWRHNDPASLAASFVRLRQMLERLGNPEKKMHYIHVTGTSGKGSVTALIHDMLLAAEGPERSRRVASYTSPHTTTLLERFRVNEKLIAPDALCDAIDIVLAAHTEHRQQHQPLSFFELTTCVAFIAFAKANVQWCVLEVGLGGRWDSTNIIPHKNVAVITNIDLDHTEILGNSLTKITYEKAGIITVPCTVICGEERKSLQKIILHEAKSFNAKVLFIKWGQVLCSALDKKNSAQHLSQNTQIASAAARAVGVSETAIANAIKNHKRLPCRFELMNPTSLSPALKLRGATPCVVLDGAHNIAKIRATLHEIQNLQATSYNLQPLIVIFGCKQDKNAKKMLSLLAKHATTIHTTQYKSGRGKPMDPEKLLAMIPKKKRGQAFAVASDALAFVGGSHSSQDKKHETRGLKHATPTNTILVTGSLYLAGELRAHWVSEETILRNQQS